MSKLPFEMPAFNAALPAVTVKARQLAVNYAERLVGQMKHNLREMAELKADPASVQALYHHQTEAAKAFTAHSKQQAQLFNELLQEMRTDIESLARESAATVTAKQAA